MQVAIQRYSNSDLNTYGPIGPVNGPNDRISGHDPGLHLKTIDELSETVAPWQAAEKLLLEVEASDLECADNGGALDFPHFYWPHIQNGVALRLPPHSKRSFSAAS